MKNFSLITRLLGWMLSMANRDVYHRKQLFYKIKHQILQKHGVLVGSDIQHIKARCYTCNGTGMFYGCFRGVCHKCGGDGIYSEFWIVLERWQIGKYVFHRPVERLLQPPANYSGEIIEGYIRHEKPRFHIGAECFWWLLLIYDPKEFFHQIGNVGYGFDKRTPMVFLTSFIMWLKILKSRLRSWVGGLKMKRFGTVENEDVPF